jgi:hypothetical protein
MSTVPQVSEAMQWMRNRVSTSNREENTFCATEHGSAGWSDGCQGFGAGLDGIARSELFAVAQLYSATSSGCHEPSRGTAGCH